MAKDETQIKLRFLANREVKDHNGKVIAYHKAGQVKSFSEDSARHWLSRGLAEEVVGQVKTTRRGKAEVTEPSESEESDTAERKAPPPADPMTHADHPAAAAATGKDG